MVPLIVLLLVETIFALRNSGVGNAAAIQRRNRAAFQLDKTDSERIDVDLRDESTGQTIGSVSSDPSPKGPEKYFLDVYALEVGPKQLEFGHVLEDPNEWEQRYEKKDHENNRFQGKVRWGDKEGGYGEHYWDFNHAGHTKQ